MKVIRLIFILIVIHNSNKSYCCDCKDLGPLDSLRKISYNLSDIIFLGELIDYNIKDDTYKFQIIEMFKGEYDTTLIKGKSINSCSKFPRDKCKWIVYANFVDDDYINISQCLASRSELDPICENCYEIPPPPLNSEPTQNEINKVEEFTRKAKDDWNKEIDLLRKIKLE